MDGWMDVECSTYRFASVSLTSYYSTLLRQAGSTYTWIQPHEYNLVLLLWVFIRAKKCIYVTGERYVMPPGLCTALFCTPSLSQDWLYDYSPIADESMIGELNDDLITTWPFVHVFNNCMVKSSLTHSLCVFNNNFSGYRIIRFHPRVQPYVRILRNK